MNFFNQLKKWLFPQYCLCCDEFIEKGYICSYCNVELPYLHNACQQCAYPLTNEALICGSCIKRKPAFDKTFALFLYRSPIDVMLKRLKFNAQLHYAHFFAHCFSESIPAWYQNDKLPEAIVPMPLHNKRLKMRGYNQAFEICRALTIDVPVLNSFCFRKRHTQPQSELDLKKRHANVYNAFAVEKLSTLRHVAIMDDIVTSANTANALSMALKRAGIERIDVWACARASLFV